MIPSIGDKQTQARDLADHLLGTCEALPDWVIEDQEVCEHLDDLVMLCECCEWWVETHELDDNDSFCEGCQEGET